MKYNLYSIRDNKSWFMEPRCDLNDETAKRWFAQAMQSSEGLKFSPQDFSLYLIGVFNNETAQLEPCTPVFVAAGLDVYE